MSVPGSLGIVGHVVDGFVIFEFEKCHGWKFCVAATCVVTARRHFGSRIEAVPGDR